MSLRRYTLIDFLNHLSLTHEIIIYKRDERKMHRIDMIYHGIVRDYLYPSNNQTPKDYFIDTISAYMGDVVIYV